MKGLAWRRALAWALAVLSIVLVGWYSSVSAAGEADSEALSPAPQPGPRPEARPLVKHLQVTAGIVADRVQHLSIEIQDLDPLLGPGTLAACRAPVAVAVAMPQLGLEMTTKTHATWYSLVDTIPPVGHQASVSVEPIRLVSESREVGTLTSGVVSFREVVRRSVDVAQVEVLVRQMNDLDTASLQRLPGIRIERHMLPEPSVDVMRVQLTETYTIDGVATDTVALRGWIAVRHGAARAADPNAPLSWENALVDTEFVGLKLEGKSDIFGPVHVRLDSSRPAVGVVGRIELPKMAYDALRFSNVRTADVGDRNEPGRPNRRPDRRVDSASNAPVTVGDARARRP